MSRSSRPGACWRRAPLAAAIASLLVPVAQGSTFTVNTAAELTAAINAVNTTSGPHFIEIKSDITLTGALPTVLNNVTIKGFDHTLSGSGGERLLSIGGSLDQPGARIFVTLSDLHLADGHATGGDGVNGGGGGLGGGGAVLVNARADVMVQNVSIKDSTAQGGNGSAGVTGNGGGANGGAGNPAGTGGDGGFGGGGGAGLQGGDGGFGAGGGAGGTGGSAGIGGTAGTATGGGGGAGLGGAIFVVEGGGLTLGGPSLIKNNGASGGTGATGQAASGGDGIFLQGSGSVQIRGGRDGQVMNISDSIADGVGLGIAAPASYQSWNLVLSGSGGTVNLLGNNAYSGDTYISDVMVGVKQDSNLGAPGGIVAIDGGGLGLGPGLTMTRDIYINSRGATFGVNDGPATLAGNVSGNGDIGKTGTGDLILATTPDFTGDWFVDNGNLVLDSDSRLGAGDVILRGGGLKFSADMNDLRDVLVTSGKDANGNPIQGGTFDNDGHRIELNNRIYGNEQVNFVGTGEFVINGQADWTGDSYIRSGKVTGAMGRGDLYVESAATYNLGGQDRSVHHLAGAGNIELNGHNLTTLTDTDNTEDSFLFEGSLSGNGSLIKTGDATLKLTGTSTHTGGVRIEQGKVKVSQDANLGSGGAILAGGTLAFDSGSRTSNSLITLDGGGMLDVGQGVTIRQQGLISGQGSLTKVGGGLLILDQDNTYVGDTIVQGDGSLLALARESALGDGQLILQSGGGLLMLTDTQDLREIVLGQDAGVIDTNGHQVVSKRDVTGQGILTKTGSGTLTLAGDNSYTGGTDIRSGDLQLGQGGTGGTLTGTVDIAAGSRFIVDRAGSLTLDGRISGDGQVVKRGSGTVLLDVSGFNTFTGGLRVEGGNVAFSNGNALGVDSITLAGGGLDFRGSLDRNVNIEPGVGSFLVSSGSQRFYGDVLGNGEWRKTGAGTLVFNGVNEQLGGTRVEAGVLQIGEGKRGILNGDVTVDLNATLAFGREDLTLYEGVVSGAGNLSKMGDGELVLTGDHLFTGTTTVQRGTLRIGYDGTTGSLSSAVILDTNTRLVFQRSDTVQQSKDISGLGQLVQDGRGKLVLTGNATHSGGTDVARGILQVGDGGTVGSLAGDVLVEAGATLAFKRSDVVTTTANITGAGALAQDGSGTLILTGDAAQSGGTRVNAGVLQVGDAGTVGSLSGSGPITLAAGSQLVFKRSDNITSAGSISGAGALVQAGAGTLNLTGDANHSGGTRVDAGVLRVGDGATSGSLGGAGGITIAGGAGLVFDRADSVLQRSAIQGGGELVQAGTGTLVLSGNATHTGGTRVDAGTLQVGNAGTEGSLAGNVTLAAGTRLIFNRADTVLTDGTISGAGSLAQNGIGTLVLTGDAAMTGGTQVNGGVLQLGNGGSSGNIHGAVKLADQTLMVIKRSDVFTLDAQLQGGGQLVQAGTGTTILSQANQLTGATWILNGRLQTDADAKLGTGDVFIDGGAFTYGAAFDDLRSLYLGKGTGGVDTAGFNVVYANQIAGQGTFEKLGSGCMTLSGLISASNIKIKGGELQVGGSNAATSCSVGLPAGTGSTNKGTLVGNADVASGAILSFAHSDSLSFNGVLSGSGTLVQRGSGALFLGADNSGFTGNTRVDSGMLVINNILGGDLGIGNTGRLQGRGRLLGDLVVGSGGTVAPGNSIGELKVGGDLTFQPGSTYEVEVLGDNSGSSDRITVDGTAHLAGQVQVLAGAGDYKKSQRYTIVAASVIDGSFDGGVKSNLAFLNASLVNHADSVELVLTRNATAFTDVTHTQNQWSTARAIGQLDQDNNAIAKAVTALSSEDANQAYDSLSGDGLIGLFEAQVRLGRAFDRSLLRRTNRMGGASRGGGSAFTALDYVDGASALSQGKAPEMPVFHAAMDPVLDPGAVEPGMKVEGVWVEARQLSFDSDSDSVVGSPTGKQTGRLLTLGLDAFLSDNWFAGFGVGTGDLDSEAKARATTGNVDSWMLGAYTRWDSNAGFHLKGSFAYAQNDVSSSRVVDLMHGKFTGSAQGSSMTLSGEVGMGLQLWRVALRPFVGVSVSRVQQDGFSEKGGDGALNVADQDAMVGEARLGVDYSRPWLLGGSQWVQFDASLALIQPWGDTQYAQTSTFKGTGVSFTVHNTEDDSAGVNLRLGGGWFPTRSFSLWGGYEVRQSGSGSDNQAVLSANLFW